jgi:hypothetical protein
MDRVKGLPIFAVIALGALFALRGIHLSVPFLFPSTRIGPIVVSSLDEAREWLGFPPVVPTYRPASIGAQPASLSVAFKPSPLLIASWRLGDSYMSLTQRRGGSKPSAPPHAGPFAGVADSTYWLNGSEHHLIVERVGFWIEITTNLPETELRRFVDTLAVY